MRADEDLVNSIGSRAMQNVRLSTQEHFAENASLISSSSFGLYVAFAVVVAVLFVGISRNSMLVNRLSRFYRA